MVACANTTNTVPDVAGYAHLLTGENVVVDENDVQDRAREVAERCSDAYSANRYVSWQSVAASLLRRGLTEAQAESVMRSKLTRFAADEADKRHGGANSMDLLRCLRRWPATHLTDLFQEDGVL